MRDLAPLLFLALAACSGDDTVARDHVVPPLETMSETPGDWSALASLVGRPPYESGLLENSPVTVDINAALGPDAQAFRNAMADAGPLRREGGFLVTESRTGKGWLVLQPSDHAFRAALRTDAGWREWQTAGAEVPRPVEVR